MTRKRNISCLKRWVWGTPTAFVVLKEGKQATAEELSDFCCKNLADFKLPKRIEFIGCIPKTSSGKISRKTLKERGLPQAHSKS